MGKKINELDENEKLTVTYKPLWEIRLENAVKKMGKAERKIADYVLENTQKIVSLTITEVAEEAGASEATIIRFCRHIGCKGFQDLKISIAQDMVAPLEVMYEGISPQDSIGVIKKKVFSSSIQAVRDTMLLLDDKELDRAIDAIAHAKNIDIYGMGGSGIMALDLQHKLMKIGIRTNVFSDTHLQVLSAAHLGKGDVVIGISYSGTSRDIVEALELARKVGAVTIGITHYAKSPMYRFSDIILATTAMETMFRSDGIVSRGAQLAIIDTLYVGLGLKMGDLALENLEKGRRASVSKGY